MKAFQTRRSLLQFSGCAAAALSGAAAPIFAATPEAGRFSARLTQPTQSLAPGEHVLDDNSGRRTLLYLPESYDPAVSAPFLVMFHGARGDGDSTLASARDTANEQGVILLCPSTRQGTWDAIRGDFADDFTRVDRFLQQAFERCAIDPQRLAIGGFSDGASYGITLGLINGDLFTHVIAHSPGFIIANNWHGKPKVYVSHGTQDSVLPFERCGAAIVKRLESQGYSPRFDVFDGGHTASPEIRSAALNWLSA